MKKILLFVFLIGFSSAVFGQEDFQFGLKLRYAEAISRHSYYVKDTNTVYFSNRRDRKCVEVEGGSRCSDDVKPAFPLSITWRRNWNSNPINLFLDFDQYNYDQLQYEPYDGTVELSEVALKSQYFGRNFSLNGNTLSLGYGLYYKFLFIEYGAGLLLSYFDHDLTLLYCDLSYSDFNRPCFPEVSKNLAGYSVNLLINLGFVYFESETFKMGTNL